MNTFLPVALGILAATTWGAADFAGGLATRRAAPSRVVLLAHGVSFLLLAAASIALPVHLAPSALRTGILSGVAGAMALMLFYEALALGAMGLSAALAGLLTAILPVLLAIHNQGAPAPLQLAGFGVAAGAIVLIAYAPPLPGMAPARRTLTLAMLAGFGFGLQLVWLHTAVSSGALVGPGAAVQAGTGSGGALHPAGVPAQGRHALAPVVRALALSRLGGVSVALVAQLATRLRNRRSLLPVPPASIAENGPRFSVPVMAVSAGLLDTAGNALYMLSSITGRLDVAAVLSSLYPGATIGLAALFLHERATRLQAVGMGLALAAVALIAA